MIAKTSYFQDEDLTSFVENDRFSKTNYSPDRHSTQPGETQPGGQLDDGGPVEETLSTLGSPSPTYAPDDFLRVESDFDSQDDGSEKNDADGNVRSVLLNQFDGLVNDVRDGKAYVTLIAEDGSRFNCTKEAKALEDVGVTVGKAFICKTVRGDAGVAVEIEPKPNKSISREQLNEMDRFFSEAFGVEPGA